MQLSKVTVLSAFWEKLPSVERPPPSGHPADSKKCSQKLHNASATAAAQPQNLVENLNSEVLHAFDCRVGPAEQMGACMAQVQHAPTGDSNKNTAAQAPSIALQLRKMAELLNPCAKLFHTSAPPPSPGRQQGLRPVAWN